MGVTVEMTVYEDRLQRLRARMEREGVDAMYLVMSGDLQYVTGVKRPPHNPTDDDKHGDELYGMYLTQERGPVFVVPRMGASDYVSEQSEGRDWIDDIIVIDEEDHPEDAASSLLERMGTPNRLAVSDRMWARALFLLRRVAPETCFCNARDLIVPMRAVKDEEETRIMQEAGRITDSAFSAVLKRLRLGMTDYDIAREIEHQLVLHGGSGVSFHTTVQICGADPAAAGGESVPVQPGSVIAFDFGVVYEGYVSDFGRTVFVGEPDQKFVEYHDAVMEAQSVAISAMRPGEVTAAELDRKARDVIDGRGWGDFFTHRLGHGIGIDVHEPPFLYQLDDTVLQEGMCFTVEPSIRIPGAVCVRVEDVVQVTPDGGSPFTSFSRDYLII